MASEKVTACCEALIEKNLTIAFAESASAGKLCYEFSTVFNSGRILIGGIICYHISMKEDLLQIPWGTIEQYSAESAEVTKLMAQNFHRYSNSDICVALTGLTTPGGSESESKPVGTIFFYTHYHLRQRNRQTFRIWRKRRKYRKPSNRYRSRFDFERDKLMITAIQMTCLSILLKKKNNSTLNLKCSARNNSSVDPCKSFHFEMFLE